MAAAAKHGELNRVRKVGQVRCVGSILTRSRQLLDGFPYLRLLCFAFAWPHAERARAGNRQQLLRRNPGYRRIAKTSQVPGVASNASALNPNAIFRDKIGPRALNTPVDGEKLQCTDD